MTKKLPLIGLALFVLVSLVACNDEAIKQEPTSWLQLVNDNFILIFLLLMALIPAGGAVIRRSKCKCHHDEDND